MNTVNGKPCMKRHLHDAERNGERNGSMKPLALDLAKFFTEPEGGFGDVYLLLSPERKASMSGGSETYTLVAGGLLNEGAPYRMVHVMNAAQSCATRGYIVSRARAYLRSPCYVGAWPEMDACVAAAVDATIVPYTVNNSGGVTFSSAPT